MISNGPGYNAELCKTAWEPLFLYSHFFVPVGIETTGTFEKAATRVFHRTIGNHPKLENVRTFLYLPLALLFNWAIIIAIVSI